MKVAIIASAFITPGPKCHDPFSKQARSPEPQTLAQPSNHTSTQIHCFLEFPLTLSPEAMIPEDQLWFLLQWATQNRQKARFRFEMGFWIP